jgi:predicted translin family RNA/ssDNA-binding protein
MRVKLTSASFPVSSLAKPLPAFVSKSVDPLLETIKNLLTTITPDLQDMNGWRYQRQISPGLQEFIEAVAFRHYLTTQRLLTVEDARALLPTGIMLTVEDWALGIFDTIGEIMRWTITGIATGREIPGTGEQDGLGRHTLMDLRLLRVHLDLINAKGSGLSRDLHKKQEVMRQCVDKVEKAAYELTVRGKERPKGWVPEDGKQDARVEVESY